MAYGWIIEPDIAWHKFYRFGAHRDYQSEFEKEILILALDEEGFEENSTNRLPSLTHNSDCLYVRNEYRTLVNSCLKALGKPETGYTYNYVDKGIVLTGQPGSGTYGTFFLPEHGTDSHLGKTTWLWFMLACCIMQRYNVIFHYREVTRFFFEGRVYQADKPRPTFMKVQNFFAWSLIDSDTQKTPPPSFLTDKTFRIFPIQASSPDEARYAIWLKECQRKIWGMPLWTFEEMVKGCVCVCRSAGCNVKYSHRLKTHEKYKPFWPCCRKKLTLRLPGNLGRRQHRGAQMPCRMNLHRMVHVYPRQQTSTWISTTNSRWF